MLPLLIFGPIFGIAALAALVAHAHKGATAPRAQAAASSQHTQQFELDHGMPEPIVHQVLTALVHEQDAVQLEALARQLAAKYPIAASELHDKAASLAGSSAHAEAPAHHAGSAPAAAASPDMGEAAMILQAAMRAYAQETDPVSLEGFAESIREKYPTATILLVGRAQELRAEQTAAAAPAAHSEAGTVANAAPAVAASAGAAPVLPVVPPPPAPTPKVSTYVVQPGDTPTEIAEKLGHDGKRWPELVAANPTKPTTADGNFVTLRAGETLHLPASWSVVPTQHTPAAALPKEAHP